MHCLTPHVRSISSCRIQLLSLSHPCAVVLLAFTVQVRCNCKCKCEQDRHHVALHASGVPRKTTVLPPLTLSLNRSGTSIMDNWLVASACTCPVPVPYTLASSMCTIESLGDTNCTACILVHSISVRFNSLSASEAICTLLKDGT